MNYREAQASPALQKYVKRFWSLEYDSAGPLAEPETILPDGCPEIVFNLSDRFKRLQSDFEETQPAAIFAGQMSHEVLIRPTGRVSLFGVRFHPAGAVSVSGGSMHELTDNIVDVSQVHGSCGRELIETITEASGFDERVRIFENHFRGKLAYSCSEDYIAGFAAGIIVKSRGLVSVSRLTEIIGISERRLERKFRKQVGISPKMLARTIRFQNVVSEIQSAPVVNLLDTALTFGYFDQSHMIREFKEFSGGTPLGFLKRAHNISDVFTAGA